MVPNVSVNVDMIFFQQQLAVLSYQMHLVKQIMDNMDLRMDELQSEIDLNMWDMEKIGLDTDEDYYPGQPCDCPECRDDRAYRMD